MADNVACHGDCYHCKSFKQPQYWTSYGLNQAGRSEYFKIIAKGSPTSVHNQNTSASILCLVEQNVALLALNCALESFQPEDGKPKMGELCFPSSVEYSRRVTLMLSARHS